MTRPHALINLIDHRGVDRHLLRQVLATHGRQLIPCFALVDDGAQLG
jgi:hypothetical protein